MVYGEEASKSDTVFHLTSNDLCAMKRENWRLLEIWPIIHFYFVVAQFVVLIFISPVSGVCNLRDILAQLKGFHTCILFGSDG